jgi:hypothetical protein
MGKQFSLPAQLPPSVLLAAAADAAGRTSAYVTLKNAEKAYVLCEVNQGNAATVEFSITQATDVSGDSEKAIGVMPIWLVNNTASSDAWVPETAAANYTTDANLHDKLVLFEILPEACMDMANGFDCIAVTTGASNAANITSAKLLYLAEIQAIGASMPSTLTN